MTLADAAEPRHDLSRCAIAALKGVMLDEGHLQRMQRLSFCDALDGRDLRAVIHDGKRQARIDALAVYQHRAGPARTLVAPLFGAGQREPLPQHIQNRQAGIDNQLMDSTIHVTSNGSVCVGGAGVAVESAAASAGSGSAANATAPAVA